ncbi:MAG TPA: DmsE family decaheme c-type cytochrome [Terriglobales bacterium]|nr:DmsE family decaheme c-type cytochrome [Terriglobales bacterium]
MIRRTLFTICILSFFCFYLTLAAAPGKPEQKTAAAQGATRAINSSQYVGSETCLTCHEEESKRFNKTPMGKAFSHPHTDTEKLGCESCHGPGKAHAEAGTKETVAVRFTAGSTNSVEEKNNSCLGCHTKGRQMFWRGSPHESRSMACVDCHQGHPAKKEGTLSADMRYNAPLTENATMKKPQPELCLTCHQMRKAQLQRSSHMPYREGKVTCSSCHNPHGTPHPKQLIQATTNENCLSCHTERRGPFAWEHPPVVENCANCHEPHGTSNPQLLKVRMPRVCDSCHVMSRHPTQPQPLGSIKNFNRGCTNCHSQIHGSNHPSGKYFLR